MNPQNTESVCTSNPSKEPSLQEAFLKFRKEKQIANRQAALQKNMKSKKQQSPEEMQVLREKFLAQIKKYMGVPYHRRYHDPGSEFYNAPLYLDCCGLIRQCLRDLEEDFGFTVGPWNQAYQWDTLPLRKDSVQELVPGDLVFIAGTYFNEKSKPQRHDIVHVEVYVGGESGEATIGARWQKGVIQEFESYKFEAKSYQVNQYLFASIDTWLQGICTSICEVHPWKKEVWIPGKKSVFAEDFDDESLTSEPVLLEEGNVPIFFISTGNNHRLVQNHLGADGKGWRQLPPNFNFSSDFTLKWVEKRSDIDWCSIKEGKQLVNHIKNNSIITSKTGLANLLQEVAETSPAVDLSFFPETFQLQLPADLQRLVSSLQQCGPDSYWIYKPAFANQGQGIQVLQAKQLAELIPTSPQLVSWLSQLDYVGRCNFPELPEVGPSNTWKKAILQQYIPNPLLLKGHKFDMRAYVLIASVEPFRAYFCMGYCRLSVAPYDLDGASDLFMHCTNASLQKQHPDYKAFNETVGSIWSMADMEKDLKASQKVGPQFLSQLEANMRSILQTVLQAACPKLAKTAGCFDLLGADFFLDDQLNVHLLEINTNPALWTNHAVLKEVIPPVVEETLDVVLSLFHGEEPETQRFTAL